MQTIDVGKQFVGNILIIAPHMDDEALACGGLIARLPQKERIHVIYVTDGTQSPAPIFPGRDAVSPDLSAIRVAESTRAMGLLGVPERNLDFLLLPEAAVKNHYHVLRDRLKERIKAIQPGTIFVPFRYDRHPDHLAVNRAVDELRRNTTTAQVVEYFVYYRWRLLPKKRIQKYIKPQFLFQLDISDVAKEKRRALDCFQSQTTMFYPWQTRPILTPTLLDEECQNPEYFLIGNPDVKGPAVFSSATLWIRVAHRLEPFLQRWKYRTGAYLSRMVHNRV